MKRFVLGTANLGPAYGHRPHAMTEKVAFSLLDAAWEAGIRAFDTSMLYDVAFVRLFRWLRSRQHLPDAALTVKMGPGWAVDPSVLVGDDSMLMTHGVTRPPEWDRFLDVAAHAGVPAGQSIYADEIYNVIELEDLARVQVSCNAFDLRAVHTRDAMCPDLPLDFRSVFLQGTLLEKPAFAERRAPGTGILATEAQDAASALGYPCEGMLVAAVLVACTSADRVVLGADHPGELHQAIRGAEIRPAVAKTFLHLLQTQRTEVALDTLDPRRWQAMAGATS